MQLHLGNHQLVTSPPPLLRLPQGRNIWSPCLRAALPSTNRNNCQHRHQYWGATSLTLPALHRHILASAFSRLIRDTSVVVRPLVSKNGVPCPIRLSCQQALQACLDRLRCPAVPLSSSPPASYRRALMATLAIRNLTAQKCIVHKTKVRSIEEVIPIVFFVLTSGHLQRRSAL